jgi:hypothetical protein
MHYENVRYEFVIASNESLIEEQGAPPSLALTESSNSWNWVAIPDMNISTRPRRTIDQLISDFRRAASAGADSSETATTTSALARILIFGTVLRSTMRNNSILSSSL